MKCRRCHRVIGCGVVGSLSPAVPPKIASLYGYAQGRSQPVMMPSRHPSIPNSMGSRRIAMPDALVDDAFEWFREHAVSPV